jgi:hypothetical protein
MNRDNHLGGKLQVLTLKKQFLSKMPINEYGEVLVSPVSPDSPEPIRQ